MEEPVIEINGVRLHTGQAMTLRLALETFAFSLKGEGMGDDERDRRMTQHYLATLAEIYSIIASSGTPVE